MLRASKLKSLRLSLALSAIIIGGFVIWQSFVPQSARSKTFTFFQTAWSSIAAMSVHNPDGSDQTAITAYASKDAEIDVSSGTDATLATTTASMTQTIDADFNGTNSSTNVSSGSIQLGGAPFTCGTTTAKDADNNVYNTVLIGSQCWMKENLKRGTRINGSVTATNNGTVEKYCYDDIVANCTAYGALYQWDEAMDYSTTDGAQGICPTGFHIPRDSEWYTLENYLKDSGQTCSSTRNAWECVTAGTKLLSGGSSGFVALLGGHRKLSSPWFEYSPSYFLAWSSTQNSTNAYYRGVGPSQTGVFRGPYAKTYGEAVRCLKNDISSPLSPPPYASSGTYTSGAINTGQKSDFTTMSWNPTSQPAQTGSNPLKFQLSSSNSAYSDDFSSASLDTAKWTSGVSAGGSVGINANKLREIIPSGTSKSGWVESVGLLSGDFDVQVDFDLIDFPQYSGGSSADYIYAWMDIFKVGGSTSNQTDWQYIGRRNHENNTTDYVFRNKGSVTGSDTNGKLRVVRSGSVLTAYYWTSSGWTQLLTPYTSFTTDDVNITLKTGASANATQSTGATIDFDNFIVWGSNATTVPIFYGPQGTANHDYFDSGVTNYNVSTAPQGWSGGAYVRDDSNANVSTDTSWPMPLTASDATFGQAEVRNADGAVEMYLKSGGTSTSVTNQALINRNQTTSVTIAKGDDFDIQVDFNFPDGLPAVTAGTNDLARLWIYGCATNSTDSTCTEDGSRSAGDTYLWIALRKNSADTYFHTYGQVNGSTGSGSFGTGVSVSTSGESQETPTSGKLRIVRAGTTLTAYYMEGGTGGWTALGSATWNFKDKIRDYRLISNLVHNQGTLSLRVQYDNFVVNTYYTTPAGETIWSGHDGSQYLRYKAYLNTADTAYTPSLDDITINYEYYPTGVDYILTSSVYDSGDGTNLVNQLKWNETTPANTGLKFQIRTSPDNSTWTSYVGPDGTGASYFSNTGTGCTKTGTEVTCSISSGIAIGDGVNDRWFQYKTFLSTTDSGVTPTLSDVTLQYVINTSPQVSAVSAGAQDSTGKSTIQYTVYDQEEGSTDNRLETYYFYDAGTTLSGALDSSATGTMTMTNDTAGVLDKILTVGYILIDNEVIQYDSRAAISGTGPYTTTVNIVTGGRGKWISGTAGYSTIAASHSSGAAIWAPIPDAALSGATSPSLHIACGAASASCASSGTAKTYSVVWDPNNHFDELYKTGMKVRAAINDKNAANQFGAAESATFTIDTKDPSLGANVLILDSSGDGAADTTTQSRSITLKLQNITEDSNLDVQFSNDDINYGIATNSSGTITDSAWKTITIGTYTADTTAWNLLTGNGSKTVYVKVKDIYGNPVSPSAQSSNISYNITPEFNSAYDAGTGYSCDGIGADGVCIRQLTVADDLANAGKVEIKYQVRDQDTDESAVTPGSGNVNVFFKYSVNGGTDWSYAAGNLSGDGSDNGANAEGALQRLVTVASDADNATLDTNWTTHTTYWDAKTALGEGVNYASPIFRIMGFADDKESSLSRNGDPASNLGLASAGTSLDIKNPATVSVTIDGGATTVSRDVNLTLNAADDSNVQIQYGNDTNNDNNYNNDLFAPAKTDLNNDGTVATNSGVYSSAGLASSFTSALWRLNKGVSTTKRVFFKVRDIYGNTATVSDTIDYNQTPEFDATFGANGLDVYQCQITDSSPCDIGKVRIQYRIRDKDRLDGLQNPVTAAIEYLNVTYQAATTLSDAAGTDRTNLAMETVNSDYNTYNPDYKTFTTYWNAKTDFAGQFQNNTAKVRVTINDGETVSNTVQQESGTYILDTQNPTLGGTPISINGGNPSTVTRSAALTLSASDNTGVSLFAQYSSDGTNFGAGTDTLGALDSSGSTAAQTPPSGRYEAYGASKVWTLPTPSLSANIDASVQTIPLTSAAGLPSSGWILIDSERIYYPSISGNNLTSVSRGQVDTTAATHSSGIAVEVDGTRTVSVKFFDQYGNGLAVSASSDSILYDQTPAGVIHDVSIQDASNTLTNNWRLFLSWRTLETATLIPDFKQYKVFRCKTGTLTDANCPVALSSDIGTGDTTVPVSQILNLASSGTVDIDGEIMTYTGLGSSELTCGTGFTACLTGATRGANNTTASSHSSGAQAYSQLTNLTAQAAVLSGAIDSSQTAGIALNSINGFSSSGSVLIDNEVITYTSLIDTTLSGTVTRGAKGTTAAIHSSGAQVQSLDANLTTNYYTDNFSSTDSSNANPNQTKYFYFVRSEDLAGNVAPKSSIVSSVPNGAGGRDTIPVRVYDNVSNCSNNTDTGTGGLDSSANTTSGVDCSTIGTNSATIKWKTKNSSTDVNTGDQDQGKGDSFIEYGTVSGTYGKSAGLHNYTADHSIVLTGLTPSTTYYFRVRTRDGVGNIDTTKTDGTGGVSLERSFTTAAVTTAASIVASPAKNRATISWNTTDATNSLIEYWKLADQNSQQTSCNRANAAGARTAGQENDAVSSNPGHSVTIAKDLAVATVYCYRVKSKDGYGNDIASSERTFTTLSAPTVSNDARADSADIQTNTAIVKWTTSDNTTSFIEFWNGSTGSPQSRKTAGDDTLTMNHSVQLPDDLLINTKYYFQVKSKDDDDNAVTSSNANCVQADANGCYFTTLPPPAPGAITVSNVGMNKATIAWATTGGNDSKTNSLVEYVNYDNYNFNAPSLTVWKTAGDDQQSASHSVAMPVELAAASKYFVRVSTRDGKGNSVRNIAQASTCPTGDGHGFDSVVSECYFTTKPAPVISNVRVAESLKDKLTITWLTDAAATSLVEYGVTIAYASAITDPADKETINHSIVIDGLNQKTIYHFRVRSEGLTPINSVSTKVANLSQTNDFTAQTALDPGDVTAPVISAAAASDVDAASAVITWATDEPADSQVFYTTSNPATALLNSKHEARNSKQIANSNNQNSKHLILGISDLNIVSDFGFRISKPISPTPPPPQPLLIVKSQKLTVSHSRRDCSSPARLLGQPSICRKYRSLFHSYWARSLPYSSLWFW